MSTETLTDVAVRTEDVWKIYAQEPEDVEAVRGVSIEVREGDFMTMGGPSGSGKTTLLNMLGGLTRPTRGRIWVRDLEITTLSNKELARLPSRASASSSKPSTFCPCCPPSRTRSFHFF